MSSAAVCTASRTVQISGKTVSQPDRLLPVRRAVILRLCGIKPADQMAEILQRSSSDNSFISIPPWMGRISNADVLCPRKLVCSGNVFYTKSRLQKPGSISG